LARSDRDCDGTRTDVAIESAKITLVKGDLQRVNKAKELSHAVMKKSPVKFIFCFFIIWNPIAAGFYILVFYFRQ
jgi:Cu2+-exporting ATPase